MNRMPTPPPVVASATPAMMAAMPAATMQPTNQATHQATMQAARPPAAPQQAASYPSYPSAAPQPLPSGRMEASSSMQMASEDTRRIKPWMFIAAIIIAGAVIAAIVGLSGPNIPAGLEAPAPSAPSAPAPPASK